MDRLEMSAAMPADTAERLSDVANESIPFNPWDEDLLHDLLPKYLREPVAALLQLHETTEQTKDSFGVDAERYAKFVMPLVAALYKACKEEWGNA